MTEPEIIDTATDLVASLPRQYGHDIPTRALVVLVVGNAAHPNPLHVLGIYVAELDSCAGCCTREGDWWGWVDTSSRLGCSAVAIVIDDEADGPGDSGQAHARLVDRLALHLHEQGVALEAAYAARATAAAPVWSLDTEEHLGTAPEATPGPQADTYALRADVVTRPDEPIARLV